MKLNLRIDERIRKIPITPAMWVMLGMMALAAFFAFQRYAYGIGAVSDLSNAYGWGFWISFDLYCGVALGSGAFTIVAIVEIFDLEEFHPLVRPSVLTGFIGYVMVIIALMVDLGQPLRIWHMMVYQNHTSILFEIGLCVMLYTTTLAIEFAPVFFEGINQKKLAQTFRRILFPFAILGVTLSTLHQSSLGSMLIIEPYKLHPLWWTPILPVLFFVSAVNVGLGMIIFESTLSSKAFHRGLETHLLKKLALADVYVLILYLVIRFTQLGLDGKFKYLFTSGKMSVLFWAEILIGSVIPIIIFSRKEWRENHKTLFIGSVFVVFGLMFGRFNVSWFAIKHADPMTYVPSFMSKVTYMPTFSEVSISFGIVAAGVLAFNLAAKYLPLFEDEHHPAH